MKKQASRSLSLAVAKATNHKNNGNPNEPVANTQSLCVLPDASLSPAEVIEHHFREANRIYNETAKDEQVRLHHERICSWLRRLGVDRALLIGQHLILAKKAVKAQGQKWLPVLYENFGKKDTFKERTAQDYMKLARRLEEVGIELQKHPNHSINSLLEFFRKRPSPVDHSDSPEAEAEAKHLEMAKNVHHEFKKIVRQAVERHWPIWSNEQIEILHEHLWNDFRDDLTNWMRDVMNKMASRVLRKEKDIAMPKKKMKETAQLAA